MIESYIRDVPDFPKPGIVFKDITPLLQSPEGLRLALEGMEEAASQHEIDLIAGIESRGFLFGTALAERLQKAGKSFELMLYPQSRHGIRDRDQRWFDRKLAWSRIQRHLLEDPAP